MKKVLFGLTLFILLFSRIVFADFVDNGNGTVTDTSTGLIWQQATGGSMTWEEALNYCEALVFGGYEDWRLPNINELQTIVDETLYNPAINIDIFPDTHASYYWSSTAHAYDNALAWSVGFYYGDVPHHSYKSSQYYVRAVRGGDVVPSYTCLGFQSPMDKEAVTIKKKRALPLKAELKDADGFPITNTDIVAPPVIQVIFEPAIGGEAVDVTDEAYPVGMGTDGNQFEFNPDRLVWQFNLKTSNYNADGSYTVSMTSGNEQEYKIAPTCEAAFIIEE